MASQAIPSKMISHLHTLTCIKQRTTLSCKANLLSCPPVQSCPVYDMSKCLHTTNKLSQLARNQVRLLLLLPALFFCSISIRDCIRVVHFSSVGCVWTGQKGRGTTMTRGMRVGWDWIEGSVHHVLCMRCCKGWREGWEGRDIDVVMQSWTWGCVLWSHGYVSVLGRLLA